MIPGQTENSELDALIRNALISNNDLTIPEGLAEKTLRKLEKKIILRELILELSLKTGLVLGSLVVLLAVFLLLKGKGVIDMLYGHFVNNWQIILSFLFLVFFTILVDQVGIKFFNTLNKGSRTSERAVGVRNLY